MIEFLIVFRRKFVHAIKMRDKRVKYEKLLGLCVKLIANINNGTATYSFAYLYMYINKTRVRVSATDLQETIIYT